METSTKQSTQALPVRTKRNDSVTREQDLPQFGKPMLQHFLFDPGYHNLNHGSFGTIPRAIQQKLRHYQDLAEAQPDPFVRYESPLRLDQSRAAVAKLLNAPVDTVVFVPNATMGVNTVLRNLVWNTDGKDEILYFKTVYGGCGKTIDYIIDSNDGRVASREVDIVYPIEDEEIVTAFRRAVEKSRKQGRRPKIAMFDVVSSIPGVRFPFEQLTKVCKEYDILSLVDGAQGVGMVDIDLTAVDPDFFVSNCHKWLHVPRGCAVFYVPLRNQSLVPSSLPTSHGYVPKMTKRFNPLPASSKSVFVNNFEFNGTIDSNPYLCVKDAIEWRGKVLGGEKRVLDYTQKLAGEGGKRTAEILGTQILENNAGTLVRCNLVNVALPVRVEIASGATPSEPDLKFETDVVIPAEDISQAVAWVESTLMAEYHTFCVVYRYGDRLWTRLSSQVYLDIDDFEWAGQTLKEVCARVGKKEYRANLGA